MSVGGISIGVRGGAGLLLAAAGALLLAVEASMSPVLAEPGYGADERRDSMPMVIDGWRADTTTAADQADNADGKSDDLHAIMEAAKAAEARGQLDIAQRLLEKVVAIGPGSTEAVFARRRLGAIYRGEIAAPAVQRDAAGDAGPTGTSSPLSHVVGSPEPYSVEPTDDGVRAADLDAGALEAGGGRDASEAALATPGTPAVADVHVSPQPWRARARPSPRFEQLLRTDVGDRIFFGVGSAEIGTRARGVLEHQVEWLGRYPDLFVVVEGHSDEPGGDADNDAIAKHRAETARRLLIGLGMKPGQVDINVLGRKEPVATCESSDCRTQNRRAVIRLMVVLPTQPGDRSSLNDARLSRRPPG